MTFERTTRRCVMEEAVIYWEGNYFPYLFGEPHLAVVCDKRSTGLDQERVGLPTAPADYRKTYYISRPDIHDGSIEVDATLFMSKGWEESLDVYRWLEGHFLPLSR